MTTSKASPFRDGLHALLHEPLLVAAELMWRWCFGLSAWALALVSIRLFLQSLKVSPLDEFLLRSFQPQLFDRALHHIFGGSLARFLLEQGILLVGLLLLWSLAAAAGRAAILSRLVAMFSTGHEDEIERARWHFSPLFLLQLLRAAWLVISFSVAAGLLIYGFAMAQQEHALRAGLALSFGLALAVLVGLSLNWLLGIAPLFCIRDGSGAGEAFDLAIDFSSRHGGRLSLLGVIFFLLRLVWAVMMWVAFVSPLSWTAKIGGGWTLLLMGAIALVYFAGVDLLGLMRLGSYVALLEDGSEHVTGQQISRPDITPLEGLA